MNISKSIRLAMVEKSLNNIDMGKQLGISANYFSRFKNGTNPVNEDRLKQLANVFNMPVSEFIALGESK